MSAKGKNKAFDAMKAAAQANDMREAVEEAMDGRYYRAHDGQSLLESLAQDVGEVLGEHASTVASGVCAAQRIADASSTGELQQTAMQAAGELREAVDAVNQGAGLALENPDDVVDIAKGTAEVVMGALDGGMLDVGAEILSETVSDAVPVVGTIRALWRIGWGMGNMACGALSLTVGASVAAIGGAVGVAISPLDDGSLLKSSMDTARDCGVYGGCVTGEGLCETIHGTASVVGQVTGTQIVTIPLGVAAGYGTRACRITRSRTSDDDVRGGYDDTAGWGASVLRL